MLYVIALQTPRGRYKHKSDVYNKYRPFDEHAFHNRCEITNLI